MKEFIHTFSAKVHLFTKEKNALTRAFNDKIFYDSKDKVFVLYKYAENGLRIEIEFNSKAEKKFDRDHRQYKVNLIITPAKLLFPGEAMAKLYTIEDYKLAFEKLDALLKEIEIYSGIYLWKEAKIQRVDIAKDISTESDEYSQEVIRLAKLALHKTGYHLWIPTKEDVEKKGWTETGSTMFYNHNQEVKSKIYNKLKDLQEYGHDVSDIKGLLRFELSLKRNFLKNNGLIKSGYNTLSDLDGLFSILLDNAEALMQKHVAGPMWGGNFLSKKLQKKYIKRYCKTHESKYKKMIDYCDNCKNGIVIADGKVSDYFSEIKLSPLHTKKEFPYIPSFASMLGNEEDEKIKKFAEYKTR